MKGGGGVTSFGGRDVAARHHRNVRVADRSAVSSQGSPAHVVSASAASSPTHDSGRTLGHLPGIDALRAVAVTAVMAYHADLPGFQGGFLGVDAFFVISGFLISALICLEIERTGTLDLRAFWIRRFKRLLPAMYVLLAFVLVVLSSGDHSKLISQRGDVVAAATYVSNWYQVVADQSYFEAFARPPLLRHLWSLSVEEQFYLICPLFFLALQKIRAPWWFSAGLASGVAIELSGWMAVLYTDLGTFPSPEDTSKIYLRTDTRAPALLVGVALGVYFTRPKSARRMVGNRRANLSSRLFELAIVPIGIAVVVLAVKANHVSPWLYRGGFLAFSVLIGLFVVLISRPDRIWFRKESYVRVLPSVVRLWTPMQWIGKRSYSLYLWHWPIFVYMRPEEVGLNRWIVEVLRFGLSIVAAEVSYRFIESPFRSSAPFRQRYVFEGAAALGTLGTVLLVASFQIKPQASELQEVLRSNQEMIGERPQTFAEDPPSRTATTIAETPTLVADASVPNSETTTTIATTTTIPPLGVTGKAIGDSVLLAVAPAVQRRFGPSFAVDATTGRTFSKGIELLRRHVRSGDVGDVVLLNLGTNGPVPIAQIEEMLDDLSHVKVVVLVNVHLSGWKFVEGFNRDLAELATKRPNTVLADWAAVANDHPIAFYKDKIHVKPQYAYLYTDLVGNIVEKACGFSPTMVQDQRAGEATETNMAARFVGPNLPRPSRQPDFVVIEPSGSSGSARENIRATAQPSVICRRTMVRQ